MRISSIEAFARQHRLALSLIGVAASCAFVLPACGGGDPTGLETTKIEFTAHPTEVRAGQTAQFTAHVVKVDDPTNEVSTDITYSLGVDDELFASIDENGLVTAFALDAASISITVIANSNSDFDAVEVSEDLTIRTRIDQITLSPTSIPLTVGQTHTFLAPVAVIAAGSPQTTPIYAWTSSNPTAVSVDGTGKITALTVTPAGTPAQISVSSEGVSSNTVAVTVTAAAGSVPTAMTILVGGLPPTGTVTTGTTRQFTIEVRDQSNVVMTGLTTAAWSIVPTGTIASINAATGLATCNAAGTTTVHAIGPLNGASVALTADASLACVAPSGNIAATIVLNPWTVNPTVGGAATTSVTFLDAGGLPTTNGCPVSFLVDATAVASVTSSGLVATITGSGAGTSALRAFCSSGPNISALGRIQTTLPPLNIAAITTTLRFVYFPASTQTSAPQPIPPIVALNAAGTAIAGVTYTYGITAGTAAAVDASGNITVSAAGAGTFRGGAVVTVNAGGQKEFVFVTYGDAGTIRGQVTSTLGQYVGVSTATAINTVTGANFAAGGVRNDGFFYIVGLPPGTYNVTVSSTTGGQQTFNGRVVTAGQTDPITVAPWALRAEPAGGNRLP